MNTFDQPEENARVEFSQPNPLPQDTVEEPVMQDSATHTEPFHSEPAYSEPYRPESPYANSPYTTFHSGAYTQNPYTPPKKVKKPHHFPWKRATAAVLTIALIAGSCCVTAMYVNNRWEKIDQENQAYLNQKLAELQSQIDAAERAAVEKPSVSGSIVSADGLMTPGQVYSQNVDSVVAISSTIRTTAYGQTAEGTSSGSGFILTENGYVATNYHVIQDATEVKVIVYKGDEYVAKIVGYDSTIDLAVLKIDAENLPAVTLGSSENLSIGDMVVAIGNPLGKLTATQTVGYVSGKNREVTTDNTVISMIQTDAAINPGNSGGPLFNMKGEVVGITTAKYSGTTSGGASIEGIGFAIPMDDIANIIGDLKDHGYVTGAYLGVTVQDTDAESAAMFGLPTGAYVVTVVEGGSADRAGIQPKDIIIALGDNTITNITTLTRALRSFKAGDSTTVKVIRAGQELSLDIVLDEKPADLNTPTSPDENSSNSQRPGDGSYDEWFDYFRKFFENNNID